MTRRESSRIKKTKTGKTKSQNPYKRQNLIPNHKVSHPLKILENKNRGLK